VLIFENVTKSFSNRLIVDDLSFKVEDNHILAILGPSGVGKTTILRIAAGTVSPDAGKTQSDRQKIGFIFQEHRLLPWRTALGNIMLVLKGEKKLAPQERRQIGMTMLQKMGLKGFEHYYPAQLSGGMRQRVSIARAFVIEPDLLLMDEPFTGLDLELKASLQKMLLDLLSWHPTTVIYVTHEPRDAVLMADEAIVLAGDPGKITARIKFDCPKEERDQKYIQENTMKLVEQLMTPGV